MKHSVILPNESELMSSCHFYLLHTFCQHLLNQQLSDAYSMANVVQYIEISEIIKTLSQLQEALNLFQSQNHLPPHKTWALENQSCLPLRFTQFTININMTYHFTVFINVTLLFQKTCPGKSLDCSLF